MDEKWIEKQMKLLDLTREEAIQLWNDDHDIDQGKPKDFDLTKEQEKESKKARNAGKRKANYSLEGQKKRERKPNEEKRSLIEQIASAMESFHHMEEEIPASGVDLVEIVNPEREITFKIGENCYSLALTCHRKPK